MKDGEYLIEDGWQQVLSLLPEDIEQSARKDKAIFRMRKIRDAGSLLRIILAYCLSGMSSRELSSWLANQDLPSMSSIALLQRLRWSAYWLACLLAQMLEEYAVKPEVALAGRNIVIQDASSVSRPGSEGTDRRIHLSFGLAPYRVTALELTDASGGETFTRMDVGPGDVVLADRGYAHRRGIWYVVSHQSDVVVRINYHDVPLVDERGNPFDIIEHLKSMKGQIAEWDVSTRADERQETPRIRVRLVVKRLDPESAARERKHIKERARKKHQQISSERLIAAEFILVFTTLSVEEASSEDVMDLFRYRWQIEVVFHRLKSIVKLDELPPCSDELLDTILLGRLIGALLIEKIGTKAGAFSPCGAERSSPGKCLSGLEDDIACDTNSSARKQPAFGLA